MTTLADFTVATIRPQTGEEVLRVRRHGYKLLGAAALYDLLDRGRLGRTGEGIGSRVVLLDPSPVPEPSLEHALSNVRRYREQYPRNAILRMGGGLWLREGIHGGLAKERVLGPRRGPGSSAATATRSSTRGTGTSSSAACTRCCSVAGSRTRPPAGSPPC